MAKNTSRDKVWAAAIDLRDDLADPNEDAFDSFVSAFRVPEVKDSLERHGEDVPSDRTISDTLESMADAGVVEQRTAGGHGKWARYEPPESMKPADPDGCDYCDGRFGITGSDRIDVTMWDRDGPSEKYHLCRECLAAFRGGSER